jgi:PAS domain S-box-containing protein
MQRNPDEINRKLARLAARRDDGRDRLTLLREIQVYQEALVAQNEKLTHAQHTIEETRDRFVQLYDFAPSGYLTLDRQGLILQLNLTAAAMLGVPRQEATGRPLVGFVDARHHRTRLLDFLRRCRTYQEGAAVSVEIRLTCEGRARDVQLLCKPDRHVSATRREYLTAMVDLTEQKGHEAKEHKSAREHAELASRLISVQDEERHRIARDLHDNVGQQVTGLRLKLSRIESAADESLRPRLQELEQLIEQLDRQLDFIARELRPAVLDLGAVTALGQFVREWSQTFGIAADFHAPESGMEEISDAVATHFYRVAQEALNNVYKHAGATRVSVILERTSRELRMIVEDNGGGFDADSTRAAHAGMGLLGMRERARLVGGSLEIESSPGAGTTIFFRVEEPAPSPV